MADDPALGDQALVIPLTQASSNTDNITVGDDAPIKREDGEMSKEEVTFQFVHYTMTVVILYCCKNNLLYEK